MNVRERRSLQDDTRLEIRLPATLHFQDRRG